MIALAVCACNALGIGIGKSRTDFPIRFEYKLIRVELKIVQFLATKDLVDVHIKAIAQYDYRDRSPGAIFCKTMKSRIDLVRCNKRSECTPRERLDGPTRAAPAFLGWYS